MIIRVPGGRVKDSTHLSDEITNRSNWYLTLWTDFQLSVPFLLVSGQIVMRHLHPDYVKQSIAIKKVNSPHLAAGIAGGRTVHRCIHVTSTNKSGLYRGRCFAALSPDDCPSTLPGTDWTSGFLVKSIPEGNR
jgi:hypothetical protein